MITLYQLRYWCGRKQDKREHTNTNITLPHRRVSEATQHYAETRIPQPGSPRSHRASHQASSFSLCASQVRLLSRSLCRSHVLTTFLDPVLRGHDEAGLLAFEAPPRLPRPARSTRTKRGSRGLESTFNYCWGPLAMIDGVAVVHCGAFWTFKSTAVCKSCASLAKKVTAESHFRSCKTLVLDSKILPSCVEKSTVKQSPTLIHLRHAKTILCESLVRGCTVY